MVQLELVMMISEVKYSKEEGWKHVRVFHYSSSHAAVTDNALDAKINVNPGKKQREMRDTVWKGTVEKMNDSCSVPKAI